MSRRIDIELTSSRDDGTWTWRAAGAKQPKGSVPAALVPAGAAVGDVLRAEIDATLDGTEVLAVTPPKAKHRSAAETIELLPRNVADDQLVTTTLAGRRGGDRGDRRDRRDRGDRGDRRPRGERGDRGDRGPRRERGDRPDRGADGGRGPRSGDGGRRDGDRATRPRRERPAPPPRPKAKRLRPGRTHRTTALQALPPEEQAIAELVLRDGIPGVRQAVSRQNEAAKAEGGHAVRAEPIVAVAERLLPALRAAEWRDRAEAAVADLAELDLRDLRSVVVAAEGAARDEEARELARQLREGLAQRVDAEQHAWLAEIATTLDEGRVVRALRLSSRPPKAGAPLPAELATRLTEAASGSLTSDTIADRWATVLDALATSPVRLTVEPASRPESPSDELVAVVKRAASRVPKVAAAFGIEAPAEPSRRRGGRPGAGGPKRPPKPPRRSAAAPSTAAGGGAAPSAPPAPSPAAPDAPPAEPVVPAVEQVGADARPAVDQTPTPPAEVAPTVDPAPAEAEPPPAVGTDDAPAEAADEAPAPAAPPGPADDPADDQGDDPA